MSTHLHINVLGAGASRRFVAPASHSCQQLLTLRFSLACLALQRLLNRLCFVFRFHFLSCRLDVVFQFILSSPISLDSSSSTPSFSHAKKCIFMHSEPESMAATWLTDPVSPSPWILCPFGSKYAASRLQRPFAKSLDHGIQIL